jgi:hypothetical protein
MEATAVGVEMLDIIGRRQDNMKHLLFSMPTDEVLASAAVTMVAVRTS